MTNRYLVIVWRDLEPDIEGPFDSEKERDEFALAFRKEEGEEHGIYPLDIEGKVEGVGIEVYSGAFFHSGEETEEE